MARHRVSPVTVQRAIARLSSEGIVEPRPGRGTFVAQRPSASTVPDLSWQEVALGAGGADPGGLDALLAMPPEGTIPLTHGYVDAAMQPTAALATALARAARRPGAWDRLPVEGLGELREWFATQAGGALRGHDVVISSGGQQLLGTAFRALAAPGEPVLVESPTYLGALAAARSAGLVPIPVPADADGVRPDLLERAFEQTGARLFYCQPAYANPHGATLADDRRGPLLRAVADAGAFVIEDDWARDMGIDSDPPPPLVADDADGHVVHMRSLTKVAAPSLRVAAVAARGAAGARLRAARVVDDFFVAGPLQLAALELVSSPAWRRHLKALRAALRERRDVLVAAVESDLPGARIVTIPSGGFHLWLRLPDSADETAIVASAAAAGVLVSPGRPWHAAEPPAPHLRLTFAGAAPDALAEGVRRLAAAAPILQDGSAAHDS